MPESTPTTPELVTPVPAASLAPADTSLPPPQEARRLALQRHSRTLAGLYARAVQLLETCDHPADMALLGHCVRETLNRLPDVLGESIGSSRGDQDRAVGRLAVAWEAEALPVGLPEDVSAPPVTVPVPRTVYDAARTVVHHYRSGTDSNLRKAEFLATGAINLDRPVDAGMPHISVVVEVRSFFMDATHVPVPDPTPSAGEKVRRRFELFEQIIDQRLESFWAGQVAVRDLVARANRKQASGPSGTAPETAVERTR